MTKIVYNAAYGGYSLNDTVRQIIAERKGLPMNKVPKYEDTLPRHDIDLVAAVEQIGPGQDLEITELPSDSLYRIEEYDGLERVVTPDMYKWITLP